MAVKARITAIKRNDESIVTRESTNRVHVDIEDGNGQTVEVIVRADGRVSVEVKVGYTVTQRLDLTSGYRLFGSIVDGKAELL